MRGFTLVEMLVAITLLGVMGLVSWRGVDYVARHIERVDRESDELGRVLRVLSQMERDFAQRLPDMMLAAPGAPLSLPGAVSVSRRRERSSCRSTMPAGRSRCPMNSGACSPRRRR